MTNSEKLLEKIRNKKIVDIVSTADYHTRTDDHEIGIECGDHDSDGGERVLLLDDGSCICVWSSEWGGLEWFPPKGGENKND